MLFTVYQNLSLREARESDLWDDYSGWETIFKTFPGTEEESLTSLRGSDAYSPDQSKFYKEVAQITADDLEEVYKIGNIGPEENIVRLAPMRSVSVGDIVVDEKKKAYMVEPGGFKKINFLEVS